jgi:hypothetical protein
MGEQVLHLESLESSAIPLEESQPSGKMSIAERASRFEPNSSIFSRLKTCETVLSIVNRLLTWTAVLLLLILGGLLICHAWGGIQKLWNRLGSVNEYIHGAIEEVVLFLQDILNFLIELPDYLVDSIADLISDLIEVELPDRDYWGSWKLDTNW